MSQPTLDHPVQAETGPLNTTDILLNLILIFLAPMFLTAAGGDIAYARIAAAETVRSYRAQAHCDLLAIAQVIAFGLAALGSLGLSMADDLSLSMILRLRGNAQSSHRAGEKSRQAVLSSRHDPAPAANRDKQDEGIEEAKVLAAVAETRKRATEAAEAQRQRNKPQPSPEPPAPAAVATPTATNIAKPHPPQQMPDDIEWANAAMDVAAEITAQLPSLAPDQRQAAINRVASLTSMANRMLEDDPPPQLRPGMLG